MPDPLPNPLAEPLKAYVGAPTAKAFAEKLGLRTTGDLVHHYPRRYAERGELTRLGDLELGEHVTVVAEVEKAETVPMKARRGSLFKAVLTDGRAHLDLVFFRPMPHRERLRPGRRGMFAGKVEIFGRRLQLAHPEYQLLDEDADRDAVDAFAGGLLPIYPAAAKCETWRIAKAVGTVLDQLNSTGWEGVADPLPPQLRADRGLPALPDALELVHRPRGRADLERARDRLKWDEAFVLQTALAQRRQDERTLAAVARRPRPGGLLDAFDARLPFTLTGGQQQVTGEIFADLAAEHPMHRLLQGEVGSGKTMVALRAMLAVVDAGGQAAMLAPTEVLAQQHHRSVTAMMGELAEGGMLGGSAQGTKVVLLTGSMGARARRQALLDLATGEAGLVIGTHALIEDRISFHDLGLVVVDEQHRFGVEQRDALRAKAAQPPHLLVMTATPIPRTVAMTVFGDLETSVLDELPAGRSPIASHVVPAAEKPHFLSRAWERICEEAGRGHQAYVVCPRIGDEEGEDTPAAGGDRRPPLAVLEVAEQLASGPLAGLRTEVLHGRMPPDDKDAVMRRFAAGETDVLVATTVIEVGVNVPNATAMVVMDADRFGVSQLHQLRGRVGRGSAPGLCLLVTDAPGGTAARTRLDAVAATGDGFELARVDLEQRREGDVLGQAQSGGRSSLRMLVVTQDEDVIAEARAEAAALVAADPRLENHPALAEAIAHMVDPDRAGYLAKG